MPLSIIQLKDISDAAAGAIGATPAVSEPEKGMGNTGGATLLKAGAFTAFMDNMPGDPTYRVKVTQRIGDDFRYKVERSFTPNDPGSWTQVNALGSADGTASRKDDAVFGEEVYIFPHFWIDGVAEADDTFTFSVDRNPTLISLPVLFYDEFPSRLGVHKYRAFTPDVVNSIVSGIRVTYGDPVGPTAQLQSISRDGDVLELYSTRAYRKFIGSMNVFNLDQSAYHEQEGGFHCGTNFIRVIPSDKWWTQ